MVLWSISLTYVKGEYAKCGLNGLDLLSNKAKGVALYSLFLRGFPLSFLEVLSQQMTRESSEQLEVVFSKSADRSTYKSTFLEKDFLRGPQFPVEQLWAYWGHKNHEFT